MAIPNAALQKLLQEVESQALLSQQQISQTQSLIATRRRDTRLNQLTVDEISQLPPSTPVYEGVGKMFMAVPTKEMTKRLDEEAGRLKKEVVELEKKLHYQETTHKNSREAMERILQTGGRA